MYLGRNKTKQHRVQKGNYQSCEFFLFSCPACACNSNRNRGQVLLPLLIFGTRLVEQQVMRDSMVCIKVLQDQGYRWSFPNKQREHTPLVYTRGLISCPDSDRLLCSQIHPNIWFIVVSAYAAPRSKKDRDMKVLNDVDR